MEASEREERERAVKTREMRRELKNRKHNLLEQWKRQGEERKASAAREEEVRAKKTEEDKVKKVHVKSMYAQSKQKALELRESQLMEMRKFQESEEVKAVFAVYEKSLAHMFEVYAKFEGRSDGRLGYHSYLHMGKQTGIYPRFVSSQDFIYIYKTVMRGKKQFD